MIYIFFIVNLLLPFLPPAFLRIKAQSSKVIPSLSWVGAHCSRVTSAQFSSVVDSFARVAVVRSGNRRPPGEVRRPIGRGARGEHRVDRRADRGLRRQTVGVGPGSRRSLTPSFSASLGYLDVLEAQRPV